MDLIDRSKAVRELHEVYDDMQYERVYEDGETLANEVENILASLPQENQWIPCSERLPKVMDGTNGECSDNVLMCVADDEWITISTGFYGYYPGDITLQGWWSAWADGCCQLDSKYKVIAWLPLYHNHTRQKVR